MEILFVLAVAIAIGFCFFYLGYDSGRKHTKKFQKTLADSYAELLKEQREQRDQPPAIAHNKGFREGYMQGVEDSHQALQKLSGNP
jgi:flagellar biosynthesis/type III secretory pathway protein FliH